MSTLPTESNIEIQESSAVDVVELDELTPGMESGASLLDGNLEVIKNVKVLLEAFLGSAELEVGDLFDLKKQSIVKLDRNVAAPVDIRLDNNVVARGELVVVDDNFGVRITEISSWK